MNARVHRNLNRGCWSLIRKGGPGWSHPVEHVDQAALVNAEFRVSEAGRQRVLRNKVRSVHAYVVGTLVPFVPYCLGDMRRVSYNPFRAPHFHYRDNGAEIHNKVRAVVFTTDGKCLVVP